MRILAALSSIFAFRTFPTTVLLTVIYVTVFTAVFVTDQLQSLPAKGSALDNDLTEAYVDLHHIAARPHPYNSHSNDLVWGYLLSRVHNLTFGHSHIHVVDDLVSNASWSSGKLSGAYFEGNNILVKIDGSDPHYQNHSGVLFSAHFDSVATAPGATDDGMGVSVLLHMIKYLVASRPRRTAVFNINNGEEDGLHGAHAFLQHPWFEIADTFLNLEGAAAGGRPLFFRGSSMRALRALRNTNVPHPHANVISSDAFSRGVVRSSTDYSVYTKGIGDKRMDGLDFAFYRGRSKYHTKYDSIPGMEGGKKALWAMMESTRGAGDALANFVDDDGDEDKNAVYFDLFGAMLILFPLGFLFTSNVILAVLGPALVIFLIALQTLIVYNRRLRENGTVEGGGRIALVKAAWKWFIHLGWLGPWVKFWLAFLLGVVLQVLLVYGYIQLNPFIIYSRPYVVFTSSLALAYLSIVIVLRIPIPWRHPRPPEQQKLSALLQIYIFTWALLILSTIVVGQFDVGSLYLATAWNVAAFLAVVLGCLEVMFGAKDTVGEGAGREVRRERFVRDIRFEEAERQHRAALIDAGPTEITPLIQQHGAQHQASLRHGEDDGAFVWWILQMVASMPLPVILIMHIVIVLLGALSQTLADGSGPVTVYGLMALLAFLSMVPIAPFTLKLHRFLTYVALVVFVSTTTYSWLAFPFSQEAPFKVSFSQDVRLDSSNASSFGYSPIRAPVTRLTGVKGYVDRYAVASLPSSWGKDVKCALMPARGLWTCSWESDLMPDPGHNVGLLSNQSGSAATTNNEFIRVFNATRLTPTSARLTIEGVNTRYCKVYFDNRAISKYVVAGSGNDMQDRYGIGESGFREVMMWSRTWEKTFVVDVEWKPGDGDGLAGRVACGWSEYESGNIGNGEGNAKIPALEEVLGFLPKWMVVARAEVEAWTGFTV